MIKIEIIKTSRGWNYRNSESRSLVGAINETHNKPGIYLYDTYGAWGFTTEEKAHEEIRKALTQKAKELGEGIEFINI